MAGRITSRGRMSSDSSQPRRVEEPGRPSSSHIGISSRLPSSTPSREKRRAGKRSPHGTDVCIGCLSCDLMALQCPVFEMQACLQQKGVLSGRSGKSAVGLNHVQAAAELRLNHDAILRSMKMDYVEVRRLGPEQMQGRARPKAHRTHPEARHGSHNPLGFPTKSQT